MQKMILGNSFTHLKLILKSCSQNSKLMSGSKFQIKWRWKRLTYSFIVVLSYLISKKCIYINPKTFQLESQLAGLENERLQLKQELSALREEIHSQQKEIEPQMGESQKKFQQLVESLRQKNKHLSTLLNDVEVHH